VPADRERAGGSAWLIWSGSRDRTIRSTALHRGIAQAGEGAEELQVGRQLETGGAAGEHPGAVPGDE
jgi:hypothetical protein